MDSTFLIILALNTQDRTFEELLSFLAQELGEENPYVEDNDLHVDLRELIEGGCVSVAEDETHLRVTDEGRAILRRLRQSRYLNFINRELTSLAA